MRDGKSLIGDVYLPRKNGRFPVILILTPYNRKYIGAALPDPKLKTALFDRDVFAYAVVDWRGFFDSKDAGSKHVKPGEDGYDIVEWIAEQKWSNGKVGMWGISAPGKVGFYTAEERPPHLKCIAPVVCAHGYRYAQFFFGGVLKKAYVDTLVSVGWGPRLKPLLAHPTKDDFWDWVEGANRTPMINVPVMLVTGWYDLHVEGVIDTYHDITQRGGPKARGDVRLLIGPWHHSRPGKPKQGELDFPDAARVYDRELRRFFDYWLCDKKDNGWKDGLPIRYFQMGSNQWKESSVWPPRELKERTYYLQGGGKLAARPAQAKGQGDSFRFDPSDPSPSIGGMMVCKSWDPSAPKLSSGPMDQRANVESRNDFVSYTSDELGTAVAVVGAARVKLHVSSDRKDTDLAVRLIDVYPNGRSMLVTDGIQRMRFRAPGRAKLMEPGKVYPVTVVLSASAYTFLKGHRIRILVSSSNYPRFDVNTNTGRKRLFGPTACVATNRIWHGRGHPSALLLPVMDDQSAKPRTRREGSDQ